MPSITVFRQSLLKFIVVGPIHCQSLLFVFILGQVVVKLYYTGLEDLHIMQTFAIILRDWSIIVCHIFKKGLYLY